MSSFVQLSTFLAPSTHANMPVSTTNMPAPSSAQWPTTGFSIQLLPIAQQPSLGQPAATIARAERRVQQLQGTLELGRENPPRAAGVYAAAQSAAAQPPPRNEPPSAFAGFATSSHSTTLPETSRPGSMFAVVLNTGGSTNTARGPLAPGARSGDAGLGNGAPAGLHMGEVAPAGAPSPGGEPSEGAMLVSGPLGQSRELPPGRGEPPSPLSAAMADLHGRSSRPSPSHAGALVQPPPGSQLHRSATDLGRRADAASPTKTASGSEPGAEQGSGRQHPPSAQPALHRSPSLLLRQATAAARRAGALAQPGPGRSSSFTAGPRGDGTSCNCASAFGLPLAPMELRLCGAPGDVVEGLAELRAPRAAAPPWAAARWLGGSKLPRTDVEPPRGEAGPFRSALLQARCGGSVMVKLVAAPGLHAQSPALAALLTAAAVQHPSLARVHGVRLLPAPAPGGRPARVAAPGRELPANAADALARLRLEAGDGVLAVVAEACQVGRAPLAGRDASAWGVRIQRCVRSSAA
jgi:hypothetical protein